MFNRFNSVFGRIIMEALGEIDIQKASEYESKLNLQCMKSELEQKRFMNGILSKFKENGNIVIGSDSEFGKFIWGEKVNTGISIPKTFSHKFKYASNKNIQLAVTYNLMCNIGKPLWDSFIIIDKSVNAGIIWHNGVSSIRGNVMGYVRKGVVNGFDNKSSYELSKKFDGMDRNGVIKVIGSDENLSMFKFDKAAGFDYNTGNVDLRYYDKSNNTMYTIRVNGVKLLMLIYGKEGVEFYNKYIGETKAREIVKSDEFEYEDYVDVDIDPHQLIKLGRVGGSSKLTFMASMDAKDMIGMSSGRAWETQSCMRANGGINYHRIENDVIKSTIIVYGYLGGGDNEAMINLVKRDEPEFRVLLKRVFIKNDKGEVRLVYMVDRVYSDNTTGGNTVGISGIFKRGAGELCAHMNMSIYGDSDNSGVVVDMNDLYNNDFKEEFDGKGEVDKKTLELAIRHSDKLKELYKRLGLQRFIGGVISLHDKGEITDSEFKNIERIYKLAGY